jgi:polyhydroxyalkanoate synthesis regulator phasin
MITSGTNEPKENHNETTPMTSEESERVIEALVAEAKLHNIPWKNILLVGSEHVIPFSEKEHSDPLTQRIANLIKIHHVKTEVPMKEQETVLQYLQTTVLDMQRKTA